MASKGEYLQIFRRYGDRRPQHDLNATALQQSVIDGELQQLNNGTDFSAQHVRVAQVHGRQDLVLAVSYLADANAHLQTIKRWLIALCVIVAITAIFIIVRGH